MEQRMIRQKPNPGSREFGELDAIVVHVFDSLDGAPADPNAGLSARLQAQSRARPAPRPRENDVSCEDARPPAGDPAEDARAQRAAPSPPFEPAGERLLVPDCAEAGPEFDHDQQDSGLLLDEDEEKFIEQTVAWLISRPNHDILLDRIWNRLIDMTEDDEARLQRAPDVGGRRGGAAERTEG